LFAFAARSAACLFALRREALHVCLPCGAEAPHVYRGRCGGVLFPRRVGSVIKMGEAHFYVAREGVALPLKLNLTLTYFLMLHGQSRVSQPFKTRDQTKAGTASPNLQGGSRPLFILNAKLATISPFFIIFMV
jgi:hypothetical protein